MTSPPRATRTRRRTPALVATLALLLVVPGLASAAEVHFTSPTGNIDCRGESSGSSIGISCWAQKTSWGRFHRRPADCDVDWFGSEFQLFQRRVSIGSCRGDIGPSCIVGVDDCDVLDWGQSINVGPILCSSSELRGITCRYRSGADRSGFRIARSGFTIWQGV